MSAQCCGPCGVPASTAAVILIAIALILGICGPLLGLAYFPRTDPGQFVINVKAPNGSRVGVTNDIIAQVEQEVRSTIGTHDLDMIVSNIGITPDLSAIYTTNSSMDTAFVQVSLKEGHSVGSYAYMERVRRKLSRDMPQISTYFQAGGLVDSVINQGLPAPIDIQVSGNDLRDSFQVARHIAASTQTLRSVSDVLIPQNLEYPGLALNIDRGARQPYRTLCQAGGGQRHHRAHVQRCHRT